MATPYKLVAGMATMPSREHTAPIALRSLLGQFDTLHLVLNGYREVPQWARQPGVNLILDPSRDYGAAGKLLGLTREQEQDHNQDKTIYYCVDDDIRYPRNFSRRLAGFLSRHPNTMVGVHGSIIQTPFHSWRDDRKVLSIHRSLLRSRPVDVVATCACAFLTSKLEIDAANWPERFRNCVDLYLANQAAQQGIDRWAISRYRGWMKSLEYGQEDSIYHRLQKDDSQHVELAQELLKRRNC